MKKCIVLVAIALAGCSQMTKPTPDQTLHYQCGTLPLTVTQHVKDDSVSFLLDGKQLTLSHVKAASGAKYSDGTYSFWSKGEGAMVQRGDDIIINDCILTQ